jgi:hypothetical protein
MGNALEDWRRATQVRGEEEMEAFCAPASRWTDHMRQRDSPECAKGTRRIGRWDCVCVCALVLPWGLAGSLHPCF